MQKLARTRRIVAAGAALAGTAVLTAPAPVASAVGAAPLELQLGASGSPRCAGTQTAPCGVGSPVSVVQDLGLTPPPGHANHAHLEDKFVPTGTPRHAAPPLSPEGQVTTETADDVPPDYGPVLGGFPTDDLSGYRPVSEWSVNRVKAGTPVHFVADGAHQVLAYKLRPADTYTSALAFLRGLGAADPNARKTIAGGDTSQTQLLESDLANNLVFLGQTSWNAALTSTAVVDNGTADLGVGRYVLVCNFAPHAGAPNMAMLLEVVRPGRTP